jgi:hypothetical protein
VLRTLAEQMARGDDPAGDTRGKHGLNQKRKVGGGIHVGWSQKNWAQARTSRKREFLSTSVCVRTANTYGFIFLYSARPALMASRFCSLRNGTAGLRAASHAFSISGLLVRTM